MMTRFPIQIPTTLAGIVLGLAMLAACTAPLAAQESEDDYQPELPDVAIYKAMLDANKQSGWVQFRNFNDKVLVYFTALQTMRCRLSEVRYSVNSDKLDQSFPLGPCDPQQPFNIPDDPENKYVYTTYQPDSIRTMTIQVVWADGSGSEIITYRPCDNVGESTCARIKSINKPKTVNDAPSPSSKSR